MHMTEPGGGPSLDDIAALPNAARRGRVLEHYVARLFRQRHFTVMVNSRAARPRQTDLIAVKLDERYLIECKWRATTATINDIDALRSRLDRTSPDMVGVLVSMNGFTEEVKVDAGSRRQEPMLLLSGAELRDLEAGYRISLPDLLYRKRESLLRDAVVLLDDSQTPLGRTPRLPYPRPVLRFAPLVGEGRTPVVDCGGGFDPVVFTDRLVDIDWTPATGSGVCLDVRLEFADEAEVLRVFDALVDLGWVSNQGRWSIDQAARTWHGVGLAALAEELPRWQQRADHHTEQASYIDRCDGGFYSLSVDLTADVDRRVTWMALSFQLEGLPLDTAPLLHLCRSLGVHDDLHVRPRGEKSVKQVHLRSQAIELTVQAYVVADDPFDVETRGEWVSGLVVDNPFRQQVEQPIRELPAELSALSHSECLICELRHHHPLSEPRASYFLHRLEWALASDRLVCCPVADWPDRPGRAGGPPHASARSVN